MLAIFISFIKEDVYAEQLKIFGKNPEEIDYEGLKDCLLLERCIKETLRLRPPIMTMMRQAKVPLVSPLCRCVIIFKNSRMHVFWTNY